MVDLCTGACGKLTSNIITVCLVYSGPILSSFLLAVSSLRLAQVKTLRLKSICLNTAKGVGKPVVKLSSEVSGMCLLVVLRFNVAGLVCSHRWQDRFVFCKSRQKLHLCSTLRIFRSLFHHFEKRKTQMKNVSMRQRGKSIARKGEQEHTDYEHDRFREGKKNTGTAWLQQYITFIREEESLVSLKGSK